MKSRSRATSLAFSIALAATSLSACARTPDAMPGVQGVTTKAPTVATVETSAFPQSAATAGVSLPLVIVHKTASCGCCGLWVEHMRQAGFPVEVRNLDDVTPVKQRVGVPLGKGSCHTAEVGGYFVEGHVPADDVKRLLAEKPVAKGLVLPGMPAGSPGMETADGRVQPYVVELVGEDGSTVAFAQHGP
ncbi:MAG: DUF411 domain-containing protein [Luteimonas sp.]